MAAKLVRLGRSQKILVAIPVLISIVAIGFWAISDFKQLAKPQQYAVYSAFIRESFPEWFRDARVSVIPIARDSMSCAGSSLQSDPPSERPLWLRKAHPGVSDDLLLRYYSKFLSKTALSNRFSLPVGSVLIPKVEIDCEEEQKCIEEFFKKYPSAPGLLRFSEVAFSSDGHLAMFEYSYEL